MNESAQRKSGAILSYVSIIVSTLVQLVYTPFLIRMLGQSEYGLYSLIASIIGYLTVLDLGFGNALVVYTAKYRAQQKYDEEKRLHGMFRLIFIILGLIVALIGLILFFNVNDMFSATMTPTELSKAKIMMLILTANMALTFPFSIYSSIINAYEKFTFQKVMSILNTILKPLIMIPLLFLGFKSIAMCLVLSFINLFVMISNYIYCRKKLNIKIKFKGFDKILFLEILGYSIFIFLGVVVDKVNWSVDQFILGAVSGTIAVSVYSVAAQINTLFVNLSTAVSGVFLPKMTKMVASNASTEELTNEMIKVGRIQFYIIFLMCTGFILVGKEFIKWWAGPGFNEAYFVSLILIIPVCFPLVQNLGLSIMQAMNKYKFKAITTSIMAVFNVFISYFLAKNFGATGAAIGTAVAIIVCNIILINIYYFKVIKLNIFKFWKNILIMLIKSIIPTIIAIIFINIIKLDGLWGIIIYSIFYTMIFCIISYVFIMNDYEKNLILKILQKFKLVKKC